MTSARIVDALSLPDYDLGPGHVFAVDRQTALYDLLKRHKLFFENELLRSPPADRRQLETAHTAAYLDAVTALSEDPPSADLVATAPRWGLGTADNPLGPNQHAAAAARAGATIGCVESVMSGQADHAFNPTGGLHHAMPAAASGFCIYNDLVIGIHRARELGAARVLYVDFDVHHGDGVEFAFASDPSVLTLSFHETPETRWPFTGRIDDLGKGEGRGSAVNLPLAPHTADESWLRCVREVLIPLTRNFRPDLIVSQHGCDPHREDPLAELSLTTAPMMEAARIVHDLAHEVSDGRWVATGGGGYQPIRVIPRAWAMVWAVMSGRELPEEVDPAWIEAWQSRSPQPLPQTFFDPPIADPRHDAAAAVNARSVEKLGELLGW